MMRERIVIVGAGISGLTMALALHARGYRDVMLLEQAHLQRRGLGINLLPVAVREFEILGILDQLKAASCQPAKLVLANFRGDRIWQEPRGLRAGYRRPQLSVGRGNFQGILWDKVRERLGSSCIQGGTGVSKIVPTPGGCTIVLEDDQRLRADLVIAADGIGSIGRRAIAPDSVPKENGYMIYRGTAWADAFDGSDSVYIAGDGKRKFVFYPIEQLNEGKRILLNWAAALPISSADLSGIGEWGTLVDPAKLADRFRHWALPEIDIGELIWSSGVAFAHPMVDIEPLPSWHDRRLVLIGDAAHAMYPVGSNGASQSIVDAVALAHHLRTTPKDIQAAILNFESDRLEKMSQLQRANRRGGPEIVIDMAMQKAPNGFSSIDRVLDPAEISAIAHRYAEISDMSIDSVNSDSPYSTSLSRTPDFMK